MEKYVIKLWLTVLFIVISGGSLYPQSLPLDDLYSRIQNKLKEDKSYLNIHSVPLQLKDGEIQNLQNIPRSDEKAPFSFQISDNTTYNIIFLKEAIEVDSINVLFVNEITDKAAAGETFFGDAGSGPQIDTTIVLTFKDIQELYFYNKEKYDFFFNYVKTYLKEDEARSLLGINVDEDIKKSKGISSTNNLDFLNFMRVNYNHRYPKPALQKRAGRSRRGATTEQSATSMQIDATFTSVSFFHETLDFGFSTLSGEVSLGNRVLNIHPMQSMTLKGGLRFLISVSEDNQDLDNDFLLDAKLMGRMRLNTASFADKVPFLFIKKPKLNVGSGLIVDLSATRLFGLPFLNFYIATGSQELEKPYVQFGTNDSSVAYYSSQQWEASMSFFWNSNEALTLRFRMDLGAANYNVIEFLYKNGISKKLVFNQIQPFVSFHMNFAPKNNDFLGTNFRYFDGQLSFNFWLKLFELPPEHTFRFETFYITAPLFRSVRPWELEEGTSLIQIRYRYGF